MVGTVLIVDDVATNRIMMKVKLANAGYRVLTAGDSVLATALARKERPELILLDSALPDLPALSILSLMRADAALTRTRIVMMMTGKDSSLRQACFAAGADGCLEKPVDDQLVLAQLRSILREGEMLAALGDSFGATDLFGLSEAAPAFDHPGEVALVMTRPERAMSLRRALQAAGRDHVHILSDQQVFSPEPLPFEPDAILIEAGQDANEEDAGRGLRLLPVLRARPEARSAQVSVLCRGEVGQLPVQHAIMALDLGASDVMEAGTPPQEIALRLHRLVRRKRDSDGLRERVKDGLRLAMTDPLTGIPNRRHAMHELAAMAEQALRQRTGLALMVVDIDWFKRVNDRFGHAEGDRVLNAVARILGENLRPADLLGRIGGEEFLVCLPAASLGDARATAKRLCAAVEAADMGEVTARGGKTTVSIGLAMSDRVQLSEGKDALQRLFDLADQALLQAKVQGRNRVVVSTGVMADPLTYPTADLFLGADHSRIRAIRG